MRTKLGSEVRPGGSSMAVIVREGITILEKGVGTPSGNRLTGESWRDLVSPDCKKPWMPSH